MKAVNSYSTHNYKRIAQDRSKFLRVSVEIGLLTFDAIFLGSRMFYNTFQVRGLARKQSAGSWVYNPVDRESENSLRYRHNFRGGRMMCGLLLDARE